VNGLYAFDALARAARSYATKHKLSAKSEKGNCATFLLKMEGVLDSLVKDMVTCELEEAKVRLSFFPQFFLLSISSPFYGCRVPLSLKFSLALLIHLRTLFRGQSWKVACGRERITPLQTDL
jgi:hypothetical protein